MRIEKEQLCDYCRQVSSKTSDGHSFTVEQLLESSTYKNGDSIKVHGGNIRAKEILEADGNCPTGRCIPLLKAAITK